MSATWARWGGVVLVTLAAVPFALLVVWVLAAWRGRWREPALDVAVVLGTAPWLWMVTRPTGTGRSLQLVPFADLADLFGAPPGVVVEQVGGNLLVFAALGFCLPMRWAASARPLRLLAIGAAGSVGIESLQYALCIGRASSIDDVLVNAVGMVLAALVGVTDAAGRRR